MNNTLYGCGALIVMKNGQVIESGACEAIFTNPQHEYTQKLLRAATEYQL